MASFIHLLKDVVDVKSAKEVSLAAENLQQFLGNFSQDEPELPDQVSMTFQDTCVAELEAMWKEWAADNRAAYIYHYGGLLRLTQVPEDKGMIQAAVHFWDPRRRCFNFNGIDLVPTLEEYKWLLGRSLDEEAKVFHLDTRKSVQRSLAQFLGLKVRNVPSAIIQTEGRFESIPWDYIREKMLWATQSEIHQLFTLAIYGLVIFPRMYRCIEGAVLELVLQLMAGRDPVLAILAETIRSLSHIRTQGEGMFTGCLPLLCAWMRGHFPCTIPRFKPVYALPITTLRDIINSTWQLPHYDVEWIHKLQNLKEEDIVWKAPWMPSTKMIYCCGEYNWVPLLGLTGGTAYAPLQVGRQLGGQQIVPILHGMEECDFEQGFLGTGRTAATMLNAWSTPLKIMPSEDTHRETPTYRKWREHLQLIPEYEEDIAPTPGEQLLSIEVEDQHQKILALECEVQKGKETMQKMARELDAKTMQRNQVRRQLAAQAHAIRDLGEENERLRTGIENIKEELKQTKRKIQDLYEQI